MDALSGLLHDVPGWQLASGAVLLIVTIAVHILWPPLAKRVGVLCVALASVLASAADIVH